MKKTHIITAFMVFMAMTEALLAQPGNGTIAQPKDIIGRRIHIYSGVVLKEYEMSFDYTTDGKLDSFSFPELTWDISYYYDENNYLTRRYKFITSSFDYLDTRYTYDEDGRIIRKEDREYDVEWMIEWVTYQTYTYYTDGRLARENYYDSNNHLRNYSLFEYENEGKTKIESCFELDVSPGVWHLRRLTTRQYDDNFTLVSVQTDSYNSSDELIESKLVSYTYTAEGNLDTEISQIFTDSVWVNSTIHKNIYNEGRISEQQDGIWSEELEAWDMNKKITYELSGDGTVCIVSFYKKEGNEWIWDVYKKQKLFFEPELQKQQYDIASISGASISQFVFNMVFTETPTYMKVGEQVLSDCAVFPNPGNEQVKIKAPEKDCVVRFYDMNGRQMIAKPFDFDTDVNTESWHPGLYIWEIWSGTQRQASGKWIKK